MRRHRGRCRHRRLPSDPRISSAHSRLRPLGDCGGKIAIDRRRISASGGLVSRAVTISERLGRIVGIRGRGADSRWSRREEDRDRGPPISVRITEDGIASRWSAGSAASRIRDARCADPRGRPCWAKRVRRSGVRGCGTRLGTASAAKPDRMAIAANRHICGARGRRAVLRDSGLSAPPRNASARFGRGRVAGIVPRIASPP